MSLRSRLLLVLLSAITLTIVIATGATYYWARHEIDQLLDYQLRQQALALRDKATVLGAIVVTEPDPEQDFVIQAWDWRGQRVYLSHRGVLLPRSDTLGYSDIRADSVDWRVYADTLGAHLIQIAQPMQLRRELARQAVQKILYPLLWALPALVLLIWWLVGKVLAPLRELAGTIGAREVGHMTALPIAGLPSETRLMVEALNDLIARLKQVLARQREFMADAAHELRTPLTALQLQTQLLARAQSDFDRQEAITELQAGVSRSSHLVERLLTYARLDTENEDSSWEQLDLTEISREVVGNCQALAAAHAHHLRATLAPSVLMEGNQEGLRSLLENLLDNALRYTPASGHVALDLWMDPTDVFLQVTDSGPGIATEERRRVFDRFYRIPGTEARGTGLGLAIVKRVVEYHDGEIKIEAAPSGSGTRFCLRLPSRRKLRTGPSESHGPAPRTYPGEVRSL